MVALSKNNPLVNKRQTRSRISFDSDDRAACGVGFVYDPNGDAGRLGKKALSAVEHRGGVAADYDPETGIGTSDGSGLAKPLNQKFWRKKYFHKNRYDHADPAKNTKENLGDRELAVMNIMLPKGNVYLQDDCLKIIREELDAMGYFKDSRRRGTGRTQNDALGATAKGTTPHNVQYLIPEKWLEVDPNKSPEEQEKERQEHLKQFDRDLHRIKSLVQSRVAELYKDPYYKDQGIKPESINSFHIASCSRHHIVYKGLFIADKADAYFEDLQYNKKNPDEISEEEREDYAIFHRRFGTNTAVEGKRAHPNSSSMAHNGEINSLSTNIEMTRRLEPIIARFFSVEDKVMAELLEVNKNQSRDDLLKDVESVLIKYFGLEKDERGNIVNHDLGHSIVEALKNNYMDSLQTIVWGQDQKLMQEYLDCIQPGGSDSAMLNDVVELMKAAGLSLPAIKVMLVPEAQIPGVEMTPEVKAMYDFIDTMNAPWDGPNTMVMADEDMILIGGDRSGFRPVRYVITKDGKVIAGSEDGMLQDVKNEDIVERGNLAPGEMLGVDRKTGKIIRDAELKQRAAIEIEKKFGARETLNIVRDFQALDAKPEHYLWSDEDNKKELKRRQKLGNISIETIEFLDHVAQKGKEPLGSMGDDAALAISSGTYRTASNFFQQNHAQVTNPPLDSIRERAVMSLRTHIGYPYDEQGLKKKDQDIIRLESPLLLNAEFAALREQIGDANIVEIDCTFDVRGGPDEMQKALNCIKAEAEAAARNGKQIVLTDEYTNGNKAAVPMLFAAGAVNTHLSAFNLRGQTSINVRTSEAFASHEVATLIGMGGADTVNAYVAEETIAQRHKNNVYKFNDRYSSFDRQTSFGNFLKYFRETGHPESDKRNRERLRKLFSSSMIQGFLDEHKDLTLEELMDHPDAEVRKKAQEIMLRLDVNVEKTFEKQDLNHALSNWKKSTENGLLKVMAKFGIAHVSSYRGGHMFQALGVSDEIMEQCFPKATSKDYEGFGGLSMEEFQNRAVDHHKDCHESLRKPLEHKGRYKYRTDPGAEEHVYTAEVIKKFQDAVKEKDFAAGFAIYNAYKDVLRERGKQYNFMPRDWLAIFNEEKELDEEEFKERLSKVQHRDDIVQMFFTGAMSDGSLGEEAHELLAKVANKRGFKSNSGEGGEHPDRLGTDRRSKMIQMASGRFGTNLDYLLDADIIQIKVAQGAKPGEGGELPGNKVGARVAFLRNCEEGTTLISPAPHHDIYSIEDLEQLIYDMKQINPKARVDVKLVAAEGVDTIATGVAKAGADQIHLSGMNGGSGASPQLSFPHAGMPWENHLNKVHHKLMKEGFRDRVKLTVDGGFRCGRDVVIAAMMGAEEYGYGLQALIAEGCRLYRSCQNNDCPEGIATTDPALRKEFTGEEYMIENMMDFIAEDVREILAKVGAKSIDEVFGRVDLLEQIWGQDKGVDLTRILPGLHDSLEEQQLKCALKDGERNERIDPKDPKKVTLDEQILSKEKKKLLRGIRKQQKQGVFNKFGRFLKKHIDGANPNTILEQTYTINNEDRTFGGRISGVLRKHVIDEYGYDAQLAEDSIVLNLEGVAGQSLGAALMEGVTIRAEAANDGVGKSLSGGKIVLSPNKKGSIYTENRAYENVILGNAALYGAQAGELYAAGKAGNRFAVALHGASAVVEGAGANACNFMSAGTVAILGEVGHSFGAAMSGGEAFVYDEKENLASKLHDDVKNKVTTIQDKETKAQLKAMVQKHFNETGSKRAKSMLDDWDNAVKKFKHIKAKSDSALSHLEEDSPNASDDPEGFFPPDPNYVEGKEAGLTVGGQNVQAANDDDPRDSAPDISAEDAKVIRHNFEERVRDKSSDRHRRKRPAPRVNTAQSPQAMGMEI